MTDAPIERRPGPSGAAVGPMTDDQPGAVATAAHETKAHAGELAQEAAGEIRGVADTAKEQARSLASDARQQVGREAENAAGRAADALSSTAQDLRALASGEGAPGSPAADVVGEIGQRAERLADNLRERGYQGLMDDVSRWARAHPGTFLLAAAGTGFAVGRLFRSVDTAAVMDAAKSGAGLGQDEHDAFAPGLVGSMPAPMAPELAPTGLADPAGLTPSTAAGPAEIDLTDEPAWSEAAPPTTGSATGLPADQVRP